MTNLTLPMQSITLGLKPKNYFQTGNLQIFESTIATDTVGQLSEQNLHNKMSKIEIDWISCGKGSNRIAWEENGSFNNFEFMVKRFLHSLEKNIPVAHLFLTPGFTLLGTKKE